MTGSLEYASHGLLVASIMVHGAISLAQADDTPPPAEPAKSNSTARVSNVQSGIVNDWLRSQSSSFAAWDFGGQFRARYEHPEYLGPVDYTNKGARRGGFAPTAGAGYGINPNFGSYVGSEIDLVATYAFRCFASLEAGIGHFFIGDYVKSSLAGIGGTRDATFVYAQFTLNF